jgi:4'-phosphopantetheinyl transferase
MMKVDICLASLSSIKDNNHSSVFEESLVSDFHAEILGQTLNSHDASLLGKIILRKLLVQYDIDLHDFQQIQLTKFGKPYLPYTSVDFSISHTDDRVVVAVASEKSVGIDIEKIRPINLGEYQREFTAEEWSWLKHAQHPEKSFFELWTKKESFLKAHGMGLQVELSTIDVLSGQNSLKNNTRLPGYFYEVPMAGYVCHLCTTSKATISINEMFK